MITEPRDLSAVQGRSRRHPKWTPRAPNSKAIDTALQPPAVGAPDRPLAGAQPMTRDGFLGQLRLSAAGTRSFSDTSVRDSRASIVRKLSRGQRPLSASSSLAAGSFRRPDVIDRILRADSEHDMGNHRPPPPHLSCMKRAGSSCSGMSRRHPSE